MKKILYKTSRLVAKYTRILIKKAKLADNTFLIILAILIGISAGFGAIGFRALIKYISLVAFPGEGTILENIYMAPWYVRMMAPVIGGLIVGPIVYFLAPEIRGSGVPDVMQSVMLQGGYMRPRIAFLKALTTAVSLGSGGSVGREGPIIQIGASLGSTLGQFFHIKGNRMTTLVGCGAAAGIAAAFNAPMAGVLFAIEIILMDFAFAQFSPIVIAAVTATFISHQFEGNFAAFQVPIYNLIHPVELLFYSVMGILCGIVSFLFIRCFYYTDRLFQIHFKLKPYLKPAVGGLLIGVIALAYPEIMGLGYDSINFAMHGGIIWPIALILVLVKILATSISLGSGSPGGIFGPSLFIGAMLGCFFGSFVHGYFPGLTSSPGAYALVAMSGIVAATTRAPITAIVIVFELTNDYHVILPLMITCIIGTIISAGLSSESIYTMRLLTRNIKVRQKKEINLMRAIFVRDVITPEFATVHEEQDLERILELLMVQDDPYVVVLNSKEEYSGLISLHNIKEFLYESDELKKLIIARDVAQQSVKPVRMNDNCQKVLNIMSRNNHTGLPVIDEDNKLKGFVWQKDILDAYHEEIELEIISTTLTKRIQLQNMRPDVHFMEGLAISEIPAPNQFVGKSIGHLDVRSRYGVNILSVLQKSKQGTSLVMLPKPDHVFKIDQSLIVAGEIKKINKLKSLV